MKTKTKTLKNNTNKKNKTETQVDLWLLFIASILGIGIVRWNSYKISAGSAYGSRMLPAQIIDSSGTVQELKYGYPLVYKDKTTVTADDPAQAGFASSSFEELRFSIANMVLNIVFWYGVVFTARTLYKARKNS